MSVDSDIDNLWKKHSFEHLKNAIVMSEDMIGIEFKDEISITQIKNWFLLYDPYVAYFVSISHFYVSFIVERNSDKFNSRDMAIIVMSSKIASDLVSIKLLIRSGFDVQAKLLLRSLTESLDTLVLLLSNLEALQKFNDSKNSFEMQNHFWFEYISKGKLRSKRSGEDGIIYKKLGAIFDNDFVEYAKDFHKSEQEILNLATHPSPLAGFFSYATNSRDGLTGMFRGVSGNSVRTLHYAVWCLGEFFY